MEVVYFEKEVRAELQAAEGLRWTDPETGTVYGFRQVGEIESVARSDIPFPGYRVGKVDPVSRITLEKVEISGGRVAEAPMGGGGGADLLGAADSGELAARGRGGHGARDIAQAVESAGRTRLTDVWASVACNSAATCALLQTTPGRLTPSQAEYNRIFPRVDISLPGGSTDAAVVKGFGDKGVFGSSGGDLEFVRLQGPAPRHPRRGSARQGRVQDRGRHRHAILALGIEQSGGVEVLRYWDPNGAVIVRKPLSTFLPTRGGTPSLPFIKSAIVAYPEGTVPGGFLVGASGTTTSPVSATR
jgi:hypothetical protein